MSASIVSLAPGLVAVQLGHTDTDHTTCLQVPSVWLLQVMPLTTVRTCISLNPTRKGDGNGWRRSTQSRHASRVVLDSKGFIKTGPDLSPEELVGAHWPLTRRPYLLETRLPEVLAAGDVRTLHRLSAKVQLRSPSSTNS